MPSISPGFQADTMWRRESGFFLSASMSWAIWSMLRPSAVSQRRHCLPYTGPGRRSRQPIRPRSRPVVLQVLDVGVAAQEPQQLVDDGAGVELLGGERGKPSARSKRICQPKTRRCRCRCGRPCPVTAFRHVAHEFRYWRMKAGAESRGRDFTGLARARVSVPAPGVFVGKRDEKPLC